ncbi:MAG: DinB family protein [Acidimicrobiales bacterium]
MDVAALLLDLYGRVPPLAKAAVDGVALAKLTEPPSPGANPIAWLIWHSARVQDHHVAELLDTDQIWIQHDWARRFGLNADPHNTGYGHSADDVAAVQPAEPNVLLEYLEAVDRRTRTMLQTLTPEELDRIVDTRWDPPVTLGVRLVSIADDSLQHVGQAAYARGLLHA